MLKQGVHKSPSSGNVHWTHQGHDQSRRSSNNSDADDLASCVDDGSQCIDLSKDAPLRSLPIKTESKETKVQRLRRSLKQLKDASIISRATSIASSIRSSRKASTRSDPYETPVDSESGLFFNNLKRKSTIDDASLYTPYQPGGKQYGVVQNALQSVLLGNTFNTLNETVSTNIDDGRKHTHGHTEGRKSVCRGISLHRRSTLINKHHVQFEGYQWRHIPYCHDGADFVHDKSLFLDDSLRRVDFVLVYKHNLKNEEYMEMRHNFKNSLLKENIIVEMSYGKGRLSDYRAMKLHCTWETLTRWAEIIALDVPMYKTEDDYKPPAWCDQLFRVAFGFDKNILPKPPSFYCSAFCKDREKQFFIVDKRTFFTPAQRSLIAYNILCRAAFKPPDECDSDSESTKDPWRSACNKFGIDNLLRKGAFIDAYPLHSGDADKDGVNCVDNLRCLLCKHWASWGKMFKTQPLYYIRLYFGTKIAFYFAWLGFYIQMLIPAAIVGLLVFIFGGVYGYHDDAAENICSAEESHVITMCPRCDKDCPYFNLNSPKQCSNFRLAGFLDNNTTIAFAIFMSVWSATFTEFWTRKRNTLKWQWNVQHVDMLEGERIRPQYHAIHASRSVVNPVTGEEEPFIPRKTLFLRVSTSYLTVTTMLGLVVASIISVIVYSALLNQLLSLNELLDENTIFVTAALLNLVAIYLFGIAYSKLAVRLTEYEMPRTPAEFETSLITKMFLFKFVNNHASIVYVTFFKISTQHPTERSEIAGIVLPSCPPSGCFTNVVIQLTVIMVVKQAIKQFIDVVWPMLKSAVKVFLCVKRKRIKSVVGAVSSSRGKLNKPPEPETGSLLSEQWEKDFRLENFDTLDLIDDYMEMLIQYSFVTIFVAAFPLAPLFALINNLFELRKDATKFTKHVKRPVGHRAEDIGIWFGLIKTVSVLAVVSNALVIALSTNFSLRFVWEWMYTPAEGETYVDFLLSEYNVTDAPDIQPTDPGDGFDNVTSCFYFGFRESTRPYSLSIVYWKKLSVQFIFIVLFIVLVGLLMSFICLIVPDVPKKIRIEQLKEIYIGQKAVEDNLHDSVSHGDVSHASKERKKGTKITPV